MTFANYVTNGNSFATAGTGSGTITFSQASVNFGGLTIGNGVYSQPNAQASPFTINGGVVIGAGTAVTASSVNIGAANNSGQLTLGANASLTVTTSNTGGNVYIGYSPGVQSVNAGAIINGGVGSSLNITVNGGYSLFIGGGNIVSGVVNNTQLNLGSGTNTLSTSGISFIWVGDNPSGNGQDGNRGAHGTGATNSLGQPTLNFGSGINNVSTPSFNISGAKGPGTVYLANPGVLSNFNLPALESPVIGAVLNISSPTANPTSMIIGDNNAAAATANSSVGVFDTTGGILNATLGTVTLGNYAYNGIIPWRAHRHWVLGTGIGTSAATNNNVTLNTLVLANATAPPPKGTMSAFSA